MKIKGIFYLKSGNIIEEEVNINDYQDLQGSNVRDTAIIFMNKIQSGIRNNFKDNIDFEFSFGTFIIRGRDLSAVNFIELD